MPVGQERRRHPRLRLRLPLAEIEAPPPMGRVEDGFTANVSTSGMYLCVAQQPAPLEGTEVEFRLAVPPGAGYSSLGGEIRGSGRVVRVSQESPDRIGVAIEFTEHLALAF